tara:strand:- start:470 stop:1345 length:876 start_codon:yes stop_codon:yes gene_type:complete
MIISEIHIRHLIEKALNEDLKDPFHQFPTGDHSSLAIVPKHSVSEGYAILKEGGCLSGLEMARRIFQYVDSTLSFTTECKEGTWYDKGTVLFQVKGNAQSILLAERTALNYVQRMMGISTLTYQMVKRIEHTNTKLLDTRKTCPNHRYTDKLAVLHGGGVNHRMGLYDMIMLKDNHIDFCGSVQKAIRQANQYRAAIKPPIPLLVEARDMKEVNAILEEGGIDRIMLDNFSVDEVSQAVKEINGKVPLEATGGITMENIVDYAETGVDYVSSGLMTHSFKIIDVSLKASLG